MRQATLSLSVQPRNWSWRPWFDHAVVGQLGEHRYYAQWLCIGVGFIFWPD